MSHSSCGANVFLSSDGSKEGTEGAIVGRVLVVLCGGQALKRRPSIRIIIFVGIKDEKKGLVGKAVFNLTG